MINYKNEIQWINTMTKQIELMDNLCVELDKLEIQQVTDLLNKYQLLIKDMDK